MADTAYPPSDAPALPFIVFRDTVARGGGDTKNMLKTHSLTVERYCETDDDNQTLEVLLDAKCIKYKKEKQWLDDEECFMTTYDFDLIERG